MGYFQFFITYSAKKIKWTIIKSGSFILYMLPTFLKILYGLAIYYYWAPWKSASAPPRGGAREPSRQLSAFHQDRANRLPEQTQRRVYSCAASALRRGGGVEKIFAGRVSPNEKLQKRPLRLYISLQSTSDHGIYNRRPPSSQTAYDYTIWQFSTHMATEWTIYALRGL